MNRISIVLIAIVLTAGSAAAQSRVVVGTGTWLYAAPAQLGWYGKAVYYNDAGQIGAGVSMTGGVSLFESTTRIANLSFQTITGSWEFTQVRTVKAVTCYSTSMNAFAFGWHVYDYGNTTCTQALMGGGGGSHPADNQTGDFNWDGYGCPLIVNTGNGPWTLTGRNAPVAFDVNADGLKEPLGWPDADSTLAFLAHDVNGNGVIDDGAELFGIGTALPEGVRASHGFEALRQHDGNGDGRIDAADLLWTRLLLWSDANHDGVSQPQELRPITAAGITALELSYHEVGRRDEHGNMLRFQAHVISGPHRKPFYDVFLRVFP